MSDLALERTLMLIILAIIIFSVVEDHRIDLLNARVTNIEAAQPYLPWIPLTRP